MATARTAYARTTARRQRRPRVPLFRTVRTVPLCLAVCCLFGTATVRAGEKVYEGSAFRLAPYFDAAYAWPRGPACEGLASAGGWATGARLSIHSGIFVGWQHRRQDLEPTLELMEWQGYDWDWQIELTETFYCLGFHLEPERPRQPILYAEVGVGLVKQHRRQSTYLLHEDETVVLARDDRHRALMFSAGVRVPAGRHLAMDAGFSVRLTEADADYYHPAGDAVLWGLRAGLAVVLGAPPADD